MKQEKQENSGPKPLKQRLKKDDLYRIPVAPFKEEARQTKFTVFAGKPTNAIMACNDDIGTIKEPDIFSGESAEYRTNPIHGISFMRDVLFNNTFSPPTKRLIFFIICKLAQHVKLYEQDYNKIRDGSLKPFSLVEYMTVCGLKNRKETVKSIKDSIRELIKTRTDVDTEIHGKQVKMNRDILALAIDTTEKAGENLTPSEYLDRCIERGAVYMSFDLEVAWVFAQGALLAIPPEFFKIDIKRHKHAQPLSYYLINLANMNEHKASLLKVSLLKILWAMPDIPLAQFLEKENLVSISEQGLHKSAIKPYEHIIAPFKDTLEALKEEYGILKEYKLQDRDGKVIHFERVTKSTLGDIYLTFELTEEAKPRTDEALQEKRAAIEKRKKLTKTPLKDI